MPSLFTSITQIDQASMFMIFAIFFPLLKMGGTSIDTLLSLSLLFRLERKEILRSPM